MNVKNELICLLIIAILTACVPNVAIAQTSRQVTNVRTFQQPTILTFTAPSQATAGVWYDTTVHLTTVGGIGIPNAQINFEERLSPNDRWIALPDSATTDSQGYVYEMLKSPISGEIHDRVTYAGDGNYAPAVSDEVITMIN